MNLRKCKICKKGIVDRSNRKRTCCSRKCLYKLYKAVRTNKNNPNWKGSKVKYQALHGWVRRHLGTPTKCEGKNCSGKSKRYDWANKSGKYKRNLKDWVRLCASCHLKMDWKRLTHDKQREKLKKIMLGNKHASKKK